MNASRRAFLRHAAAFSSLGAAAPLGLNLAAMGQASAQTSGDYRALVCIFLYGGNDSYNTVLATDSDSWAHYRNHRDPNSRGTNAGGTSLALSSVGSPADSNPAASPLARLGGVLSLPNSARPVHAGRQFAVHPALSQVRQLAHAGRVATVANVGPLLRPTTKLNYEQASFAKPSKLFSHNDQQSTWLSFAPEGASEGWGGRMGDLLMSGNGGSGESADLLRRSFTCVTPAGSSIWLTGRHVQQYQVAVSGIPDLGIHGGVLGDARLRAAVGDVMNSGGQGNLFAADHQQVVQRALQASSLLGSALPAWSQSPWGTAGRHPWNDPLLMYTNPLTGAVRTSHVAIQLQMVARLIEANRSAGLGARRQVFMVSLPGFDTHDSQNSEHTDRMAQLDHALAYFDAALGQMPGGDMRSQVTTFTASDFGRSFTSNGDGTDHGWGAHHLVMGGAVSGGEVYGSFPQYSTADNAGVFASPDQLGNGVMLPSTSVDQYAYTLGKWMGVSDTELRGILPNLGNFNASSHNLGFMG